ncbi:DUF3168 domain-containing protein [Mameliella alba]|nr:DUF3168 domain-containing protein [Antarctobacter heliothermus]MBY6143357.1 DUF3168 domain-containing protein [Mameliella alba]MBY6163970.1 DUF3168 domain-containing protein [Mameliella alba]MBY6172442.1 DUF3168 domain-containing protein [Mameliella alba]MBY6177456.1 DUF3168 domain-containing protein [Mameliella alba]
MEEALTAFLLADATLVALVGTRVHWLRLPDQVGTFPYVRLQMVDAPRSYHSKGASGLQIDRVQVDAWGETYESAKAVERAIEARLSGYRGAQSGVMFQGVFKLDARDLTDMTAEAERRLFRLQADYEIAWKTE